MSLNQKLNTAREVLISYCKVVAEKKTMLKSSMRDIWLDFVLGPHKSSLHKIQLT